jgi:hypothetical protein
MSLQIQPPTGRKDQGVSRHKTFHITSFVLLVVNVESDVLFLVARVGGGGIFLICYIV